MIQTISSYKSSKSVVLGMVVAIAALSGCGGSSKSSSSSSTKATKATTVDQAAAAGVPKAAKAKGTLTVATDASYPPMESIASDGHTVVGMEADLAKALLSTIGLKAKVMNAGFDGLIPGLTSGKYDLSLSAITDTKEREKTVDFVTYFTAGTAFFTKVQGGSDVQALPDLCGHSVALEKGTTQVTDAAAQSKKCVSAGKGAVKPLIFPDQNGVNLAVSSGRAQIGMADSPVAAYIVKRSSGQFKLTGNIYGTAPYGVAIPKSSGLTKPLLAAMQKLVASGQYRAILNKWGVASGAIKTPAINAATS